MKKVGLFLLMVAIATLFTVGSVFAAGVIDTPHDIPTHITSLMAQGTCSVCHIPHKSAGARLWAQSPVTAGAGSNRGLVGQLCAACHVTAGVYAVSTLYHAGQAEHYVYNLSEKPHGVVDPGYAYLSDAELTASGLPYSSVNDPVDGGAQPNTIQCTSCHNVHDNTANRPFLRVSIRDLCIQCHTDRAHSTGAWQGGNGSSIGTWTGGLGGSNIGTHPVGTDITGEMAAGTAADPNDSPIIVFATTWMQPFKDAVDGSTDIAGNADYNDGGGKWNLGRHTATIGAGNTPGTGTDGGVVCVSCHAIHGVQDDTDPNADIFQTELPLLGKTTPSKHADNPSVNLLGAAQSAGGGGYGMSVANGWGENIAPGAGLDGSNTLCESCHVGGSTGPATFALIENTTGLGYPGVLFPNPGATDYSHPIDDAAVNDSGLVTGFPALWPERFSGGVLGETPICESCHVPHPYRSAEVTLRGDVDVTATGFYEYLLRDNQLDVCGRCHIDTPANHHPVSGTAGNTMPNLNGTALSTTAYWDFTGTVAGADGQIGGTFPGGALNCQDCHNGTGAHNWTGPMQVGLDPDWNPVNNGRGTDNMATELTKSDNMSVTCELCHYTIRDGSIDTTDPGSPTHGNATDDWNTEPGAYDYNGNGTHFLGNVNNGAGEAIVWSEGSLDGVEASFNPTTTPWPNSNPSGNGWSRWGATTAGTVLVCESCHELEPDKNEPGSKLLLYWFQEATDQSPGADKNHEASYFCEGCHTVNGPSGTHAMSGDIVSRTGLPLDTDNSNAVVVPGLLNNLAPAGYSVPAGTSTFPETDMMNCDSCHQVHDAADESKTYILEAPTTNVGAGGVAGFFPRGDLPVVRLLGTPAGATIDSSDPDSGPDLDYTYFCDQCHWYTRDVP